LKSQLPQRSEARSATHDTGDLLAGLPGPVPWQFSSPFEAGVPNNNLPARQVQHAGESNMNKDELGGKADEIKGGAKQAAGEATGNQGLANEGVVDQAKGAVKQTWGNLKDAAAEADKRRREDAERQAANARAGVRNTVEDIEQKVNQKIDAYTEKERQRRSGT
jgi:uncharacterized protein YjbJ (UPF0337 family)